jgi:ubiquinone/menaquinone biosynthesis C-methylase UbiE
LRNKRLTNCEFQVANVLELPFEDNYFDAVFGHTILMQFANASTVLKEVYRVLRAGGIIGFREVDFGANLSYPEDSAQAMAMNVLSESIIRNGGYPNIGRCLPDLFTNCDFEVISKKASYNMASTKSEHKLVYEWLADWWDEAEFVKKAITDGWLSKEKVKSIAKGLKMESEDLSVLHASTYCQVLGKKGK